jgi:hypothetical protein
VAFLFWRAALHHTQRPLGILVAEVLIRRLDMTNSRRLSVLLFASTAALVVSIIGFGLAPSFAAGVVTFWVAGVLRSLHYPLGATWLNQHLPSRVCATVLSMVGQADALSQVAGGAGLCRFHPDSGCRPLWPGAAPGRLRTAAGHRATDAGGCVGGLLKWCFECRRVGVIMECLPKPK